MGHGRDTAWWAVLLACVLGVQGCASPPRGAAATTAAPAEGEGVASRTAGLAAERQWLQAWFDGTPVRIEPRDTQAFSIEVPREFSFDAGRSEVKPALGAVLDKLAQSLQRKPLARVELLAAPGDAAGSAPLALQRAANVRKHLLARGVRLQQLGPPTAATAAAVQLHVGLLAY
jgi:outer membrane protein OmpA-like peptidoglycan-associated protein